MGQVLWGWSLHICFFCLLFLSGVIMFGVGTTISRTLQFKVLHHISPTLLLAFTFSQWAPQWQIQDSVVLQSSHSRRVNKFGILLNQLSPHCWELLMDGIKSSLTTAYKFLHLFTLKSRNALMMFSGWFSRKAARIVPAGTQCIELVTTVWYEITMTMGLDGCINMMQKMMIQRWTAEAGGHNVSHPSLLQGFSWLHTASSYVMGRKDKHVCTS